MRLTDYTDYSLRVLLYLTVRGDGLSTIQDISDAYGISKNHLMKVVQQLGELGWVETVELEHYPGMTEKSLEAIVVSARERWPGIEVLIVHRVGKLYPLDQIVLVATTAAHRGDAFASCEFVMDYLKTQAPFWKKEKTGAGERWVDARVTDDAALARWGIESGNQEAD